MCELMAMTFAEPVRADFTIREFAPRGEENADGWGLGWYPDRSLAVVKEPIKWGSSPYAGFLETYPHLRSRIHIGHVRHKTVGGEATHSDTHPFAREWGGRDYCFAHNGTLARGLWDLPQRGFRPVGGTDSEYAFCHLMGELADRGRPLDRPEDWAWLHGKLADLNRLGTLNALLSDGRRLFAYHDASGWKGLTFRRVRLKGDEVRHFGDVTVAVDLGAEAANRGFVVATRSLSPSGWHSFRRGELLAFDRGDLRFSSHRERHAPEFEGPSRRPMDSATNAH